jgi:hypothetical protein
VAETAHGLNVSGGIIDEVHTLRLRRALVEAIETGTGARDQPLVIFITTADEAEEGTIYDEKHNYTRNVANGVVTDPGHYGVIWAAEPGRRPVRRGHDGARRTPALGKSPTLGVHAARGAEGADDPDLLPDVLPPLAEPADARAGQVARPEEVGRPRRRGRPQAALAGRRAWGGLDLSAVSDFTAWACGWSRTGPAPSWTCCPVLDSRGPRRGPRAQAAGPAQQWIADGWVETTEGDVIDYGAIKSAVIGDCNHFDMQRVSYDRMFAGQMVQELDEETRGVEIVPVAQTYAGLSPACKELERLLGAQASGTAATRSCGGWPRSSRSATTAPTTSGPSSPTASSPDPHRRHPGGRDRARRHRPRPRGRQGPHPRHWTRIRLLMGDGACLTLTPLVPRVVARSALQADRRPP